jgi:hypothetical protein
MIRNAAMESKTIPTNLSTKGNGNVYEGYFQNDNKSGSGMMKCLNGDIYEGTFVSDLRSGTESMQYSNGDI